MSKVQYPHASEVRDIIIDCVKNADLHDFLRGKGIYYFNASREEAAELTSHLLLDEQDLDVLRGYAYKNTQRSILSGFTLVSDSFFDLSSLYNTIRSKETLVKDGYSLKALTKMGEKAFGGEIVYKKRRPGRTAFLKYDKRDISFTIKSLTEKEWQVEVDGDKSSDGKVVQQLFEKAAEGKSIRRDELLLSNLSIEDTINFFDGLRTDALDKEWQVNDILRITLRKPTSSDKEEDVEDNGVDVDKETKEKDEVTVDDEHLSGIRQAILEGKNLRDNSFVHSAQKSGYIFTSMTYLFQHKKNGTFLKLRAEFKGSPKIFEVCLEDYGRNVEKGNDEDKELITKLSDEDNMKYRSQFWNAAKKIYNKLRSNSA